MDPVITTTPVPVVEFGRTHLIGIGGAGMSVIARILAARGVPVQGADAVANHTLTELATQGIPVFTGHDAEHVVVGGLPKVDTVIVSSAVRESNPELAAARAAGIRVLHRSQALASLMAGQRDIAVAGAHGKTTTTAMIVHVLRGLGLDPSFAIGGSLMAGAPSVSAGLTHESGGHFGTSEVFVAEADESDGSFLNYAPEIAVVTNVEPDHLDHYGTEAAFEQAFVDFANRIAAGGFLVACHDDDGAARLANAYRGRGGQVVTYGVTSGTDVQVTDAEVTARGARAVLQGNCFDGVRLELQVPGVHNLLNATAAVIVANLLEPGSAARSAEALGSFLGTGRRFEYRGEAGGVRVFDDYAHHPTEIAALLTGVRPVAQGGKVIVLFQPHLYSRTKNFASEFAAALSAADLAVVTGVYRAREDVDPEVGAHTIVDQAAPGSVLEAVEDKAEAVARVVAAAKPGDLIITVGAGDVTELADVILKSLGPVPLGEGG
ncbi:MAG: UDP-N-acetylmuramate--L-alanine ligase [Promicromonosporaceae bacterium]|nr:UDP-N-acetylmuramate--L-alanine ligase [Promicromonosporaceae bacterium]